MSEFAVHTMRPAKMLEWMGLTIVKKYLSTTSSDKVEDVRSHPDYFQKGNRPHPPPPQQHNHHHRPQSRLLLRLRPQPENQRTMQPDSGYILLENHQPTTIRQGKTPDNNSTLRTRNRPDVPGWFYTSTADEVYYYFLAILSTTTELKPLYSEYLELVRGGKSTEDHEARLLRSLKIDRDLLITYRLDKARTWYRTAPEDAFAGYAGAVNPTYITLSRRACRDRFVAELPAKSHGSIFSKVRVT